MEIFVQKIKRSRERKREKRGKLICAHHLIRVCVCVCVEGKEVEEVELKSSTLDDADGDDD